MTPGMVFGTLELSPTSDDLSMGSVTIPGPWVPGDPLRTERGYETDARVVLVPAAALLWVLATARRPASAALRWAARVALVAVGLAGSVALGRGMVAAALSAGAVVVLAGPVLWPGARWPAVASRRFQPQGGG